MAEQIIIDLHNSANAKEFSGNLIHQMEFQTVTGWIDSELKRKAVADGERLHEAITVLGTRGSGKTTFLMTILKTYRDNRSEVCVLDIIDPTLTEEKGHIFLDIISRIKEKVETALAGSDVNPESTVYLKKKEWQDHVQRLAHGLPLLDGVGGEMTENIWQDAEFIMHNGLTAVRSARLLEHNFHRVIEMALDILKQEAFLITFDDIDIDFRKGWRVLETIRKYFTTPKIVTLISGDIRLYSNAIRKQQWKNFGKALLINEGEHLNKISNFNDMVTQMEGQYLQKVMKLNRRVNLAPLNEKMPIYEHRFDIMIKSSKGDLLEIQGYYDRVLRSFGISSKSQTEIYRSFLLSLPIRSQIQFMAAFDEGDELWSNNFHITDAFLNDLYEKDVDVNLIYSNAKFLNTVILKLLLDAGILEEGYQLQPTLQNQTLNACLTALSFLSSQKLKRDPFLVFDYLIKLGYTRNLETAFYASKDGSNAAVPSIKGLIDHSGLLQDKVLRDAVGLMNAYTRAALNSNRTTEDAWGGTILLYTLNSIAKQDRAKMSDRIDIAFEGLNHKHIAYIPLSICQSTTKQSGLLVYSFYSLLATIGELLRKNTDIEQGLYEFSQLRSYPMPDFTAGLNSRGDSFSVDERLDERYHRGDSLHMMDRMMSEWASQYKGMLISPHLLGKISTRFFYALLNIEQSGGQENLGELFSMQIVAFLNATLIEEAKESPDKLFRGINLNNVNTSPKIFLDNLKNMQRREPSRQQLKFSRWLFSCPLFLVYLDPGIVEHLQMQAEISLQGPVFELSVFRGLCNVSFKRNLLAESNDVLPYDEIIARLRSDKVPFKYFDASPKGSTISKNKFIQSNLRSHFGGRSFTSDELRDFRTYLKNNKVSW
jgi:hypothetical protein